MAKEKRLIDANAFKVFLEGVRQDYIEENTFSSDFAANVIETVQDNYLELAPTVDAVEVGHGHWKYGTRAAVCSECGFERSLDDNFGAAISCPNCGTTMDGDG